MTTSEQIINAATELLQKHGFNAFSYGDISKLIGIRTASIHYHYPSKYDLGKSVMERYRLMHKSAINKIDAESDSPLKKLQAFAELFTCTMGNDYKMCPCGMLTTDISTLPDPIKIEVRGFYIDSETWLTSILKDGLEKKVFKFNMSAAECAKTLFSSFEGTMLSARAFEDKNRLTKSLKQIIKLIQA
ncbi:MAG: TetR family transcriptional regulator [Thermodesulfobacteriota bacterium]|nr:MAG: TetR family transcriptional regulator [Thermodesulfobacteriota bacterium]